MTLAQAPESPKARHWVSAKSSRRIGSNRRAKCQSAAETLAAERQAGSAVGEMYAERVNLVILYVSVVIVSAVTTLGTTLILHRAAHSSRADDRVTVPNLVGVSEKDARENVRALGLTLLVGARKSAPGAEPDTVVAQSIPAGESMPRGQALTVTFARATPKAPDVVGRTLDDAKQVLRDQGIEIEEGQAVASNDVVKGHVVSQDPPAGAALDQARSVLVTLSSGPSEIAVPKLLGQPVSKAKDALKEAGLELGDIVWTELAETSSGVVLNQNPLPDAKAKPGDKVSITVNR